MRYRGECSMSIDKHQTPPEQMEMLRNLLAEASHLAEQLPTALSPGAPEQRLVAPLTTLLLALNERGIAPNVQKDRFIVQSDVQAVQDAISDVLTVIKEQGDEGRLLAPDRRADLVNVIIEQSEVHALVNKGSISRTQIEMWVEQKLAQKKSS
jgi:hypothetical protein